jgi:hypothetical protein
MGSHHILHGAYTFKWSGSWPCVQKWQEFLDFCFSFCLVHCYVLVSATDPRQPVIGFSFYLIVNLYYLLRWHWMNFC